MKLRWKIAIVVGVIVVALAVMITFIALNNEDNPKNPDVPEVPSSGSDQPAELPMIDAPLKGAGDGDFDWD